MSHIQHMAITYADRSLYLSYCINSMQALYYKLYPIDAALYTNN